VCGICKRLDLAVPLFDSSPVLGIAGLMLIVNECDMKKAFGATRAYVSTATLLSPAIVTCPIKLAYCGAKSRLQ
jgi:hypothetical protein